MSAVEHWEPPRCAHGNIILGCPEEPCDEQTVYLIDQETRLARYFEGQRRAARQALDDVCPTCLGRRTVLVWSINQEAVTMPCPDGCEEADDEIR